MKKQNLDWENDNIDWSNMPQKEKNKILINKILSNLDKNDTDGKKVINMIQNCNDMETLRTHVYLGMIEVLKSKK